MLRLLKYELRKTLLSKLVLLGITFFAEVIFLIGLWGKKDNTLAIGAILLFFIAIIGIGMMGLQSPSPCALSELKDRPLPQQQTSKANIVSPSIRLTAL